MIRTNLDIRIRDSIEDHMFGLKWWLKETKDVPLEEMASFFDVRIDDYVPHMERWDEAYRTFPKYIPPDARVILDLGCGSGLELDQIIPCFPNTDFTGIDLSTAMINELLSKHPEVNIIQADYLKYPFGENIYDAVISFESLHHLLPKQKQGLYKKIRSCLNGNGVFINCDYYACCDEEETLLLNVYDEKRKKEHLPTDALVHFDIPLTLEHEADLLESAGFTSCSALSSHSGACFLKATV
ncbi:MAG: class I SAM-dependent methyltransferase [Oscillospiraceae bacterium]|nr:class I SAM-dependent methyltransferase [Oscillospiraceae bacterium]